MKPSDIKTRFATCITALFASSGVFGAGEVSSIFLTEQPATPFTYSANGIEYQWGRGNNLLIDGFVMQGRNFSNAVSADEVVVRRDDINGVTSGQPCGIFVERLSIDDNTRTLAADYPSDGSDAGNCSLESLLDSRAVNRGVVDVFSNTLPDAKNIERLDYLFFFGTLAPVDENQLRLAGHVVAEKRGNNAVKMAAILELDAFGQPAEYGPLVLISPVGCSDPQICYGSTDLTQTYSFLQNEFNAPQGLPVETERSRETVAMAFVSSADLGLNPGQRYFGVSLFADDVDEQVHDLLDPSTFPNDTSDDDIVLGDDADIYGGVAGYYFADGLSVVSGRLFLDVNMNGISDADEAAISDVSVELFSDVNGNGVLDIGTDVQLGETTTSNINGEFQFPGVADGNLLVVLDESDPQIPDGLVVTPGFNPQPLMVSGGTSVPVSFSFVSDSGTGSGSGNDGMDVDGTGDGTDGGAGTGDGTDAGAGDGTGDGTDGGAGDGSGDGIDAGAGDGSGDGIDSGAGDGNGDGTDAGAGDGTGDGTDGGAGDGTGDGADGGAGDGTDGGAGDGADGGTGDGTLGGGTGGGTDDGTGDGPNDGTPLADDATAANSDEFDVNQGDSIEVDVLANDFDGAGGGLVLVSVSESPNADITITDDNLVSYVPDANFFSAVGEPDTFTYTLEDEDGTRRTGNVSATVVRFSDLNDNSLNDFDECDCTDLFLETGVDGTGIGHTSRMALFALSLLFIGRLVYSPLSSSVRRRVSAKRGVT